MIRSVGNRWSRHADRLRTELTFEKNTSSRVGRGSIGSDRVSDAHSGFRVFTRDALETLDLTTDGMEFASEMIMDAGAKGLRIEEVPITYHPREGEAKLESFRDGWRHVKFMLVNAPGYLFSVPGMVFEMIWFIVLALDLFIFQPPDLPCSCSGQFGLLSDLPVDSEQFRDATIFVSSLACWHQ